MKYRASTFKNARLRRMWTQSELARRAGVSVQTVNFIENGKAGLWLKALRNIAVVLGLSETDIFGKQGSDPNAHLGAQEKRKAS